MRNALIGSIAVLFVGLVTLSARADMKSLPEDSNHYFLQAPSDTVWIRVGDYSGSFAVSSADSIDYINLPGDVDIILYSGSDTIFVKFSNPPPVVQLDSPKKRVFATVTYPSLKYRNLRKFDKFGSTATGGIEQFYYSNDHDSNLVKLRLMYNLDSVAGHGNEMDRIIRLLNWSHNIVRHDGSGNPAKPDPRNAINIIEVASKENKGVNCRMLATILNEVYLAMGFKSRHLTCMPMDTNDPDCHVVNMVYVNTLGKWVFIDPTNSAYFKDAEGTFLSPAEIRAKMVSGEELILNDDINWNGQPKDKNEYKQYIAKNLFRFFCPIGSEFGYESKTGKRAWIHLNPSGYDSERIGLADTTWNEDKKEIKYIDYFTDNADFFWAKPQ